METLNLPSKTTKTTKSCTPAKPTNPDSTASKVRVIVRVRAFLPHEIASGNRNPTSCISAIEKDFLPREEVAVHLKDPYTRRSECYQLDSFFSQEDNNVNQIFEREVSPFIPGIFSGCNATVFAYGATGSGKTYTMQGNDDRPGLMRLAMSTILSLCQIMGSTAEISYFEIYMDRCYDLLELKAKEITVLDDKDGQTHLRGLSRALVTSISEFQEVFSCGVQRRKVAHTDLNDVSSRSHGVLVISVSTPCGDGSGSVVSGKLNLIDLAGNEDNKRTCNEGIRLLESAKINQSLFALSNVIYALNNNKPRVPYRDCKLTRILQDSLGGTSRALMIACLNPCEFEESVHTVSLAARSRHISNFVSSSQKLETPKVKIDMEAKLRAWLESKGKTKSAQRSCAFGSPLPGKTPKPVSYIKKTNNHSSVKGHAATHQGAPKERYRSLNGVYPFQLLHDVLINIDFDCILGYICRTLSVPSKNLFMNKCLADDLEVNLDFALNNSFADEQPGDEEKISLMSSANSLVSSPASGRKNAAQSPCRKVLSPINNNVNCEPFDESSLSKISFSTLLEPKTPKTPFMENSGHGNRQNFHTPIDKFNAMSCSFKSSLIQEYVDFLNTASRRVHSSVSSTFLSSSPLCNHLKTATFVHG
ncbi:kinesin-like protein KIF22 isoform X2 [Tripterygium wilfordii]|uniref:Kinesin-like protein n=1 Tax=Tripterygium wilfordii TaxID=458696 RepID=A0A7J7CTE5_TRIWF|nr:kinesin-like protein KIF22 isoform X2 [Tripterygium wilfordii]